MEVHDNMAIEIKNINTFKKLLENHERKVNSNLRKIKTQVGLLAFKVFKTYVPGS